MDRKKIKGKQKATEPVAQTPAVSDKAPAFFENAWLPVLLLLASAIAVYYSSLGNDFVAFDDDKSIWYNQHLKHPDFQGIFGEQLVGMYVPITSIFYVIVYQLFGEHARAFHLLGLLVHLVNIVLVYRLFLRLQPRRWAAFFVALFFAVHPMLAEPVSWVSALSTLLFSCFYLVTLHLFWSYLGGRGARFYWLALFTFLLAGFSKSAAATLPVALVLLDWWKNGKLSMNTVLNKWPFWLLSAGLVILTFITRTAEGHDIGTDAAFSLTDRVFMISQTIFFYPFKLLAPVGYSIFYPFVKSGGAFRWDYYVALPALLLLVWWVLKNRNRQREIIFGLGLYIAPLFLMLPVVSVGTAELRNDRYAYLPSLGIFFLLMLLAGKIRHQMLRYTLLTTLALIFAFQAHRQSQVWRDGTALFQNCVDKTPDAALCQCNLGYSELLSMKFDASVEHYTKALELDKSYVEAYNGRGQAYLNLRKVPEALEDFNKAIAAGIVTPKLFLNRGKCLAMLGRHADAIPDLSRSLELEPKSAEAYYFRAFCKDKTGKEDEAIQDYSKAIELNPGYVEALVNRGLIYFGRKQFAEAIADDTKALETAPDVFRAMILVNRANAYLQMAALEKALADTSKAIEINPNYPRAYQTRAAIYHVLGEPEKARADLEKAGSHQ